MSVDIRAVAPREYQALGQLMVEVYSRLEGFPGPEEQPGYYDMLADIGQFNEQPGIRVLVALTQAGELAGGVVYFDDMAGYGSGGSATHEVNSAGIRLLGVADRFRGLGVGRALTEACLELAHASGRAQVILHTTAAMQVAWKLYTRLGFERSPDLDFSQQGLPVFGFRLQLEAAGKSAS